MTDVDAAVTDPEADARWRAWQARGAASDRRAAARVRVVLLIVVAVLALWLVASLA
jgi:hypothetical protein